ncbi:MAG: sensor histidine kinase N-terminal domain-containing protein [Georgfuchsia sp.]
MKRRLGHLHFAFNSLLGEILLWLMALMLFLWVLGVVTTYQVASNVANRPYDEKLAGDVAILLQHVRFENGQTKVKLPREVEDLMRAEAQDHIYLQVLGPTTELIFGDANMPWIDASDSGDYGVTFYRNDEVLGEEMRIAYRLQSLAEGVPPVLVQVGETLKKRKTLAAIVASGVIVPQLIIVPVAVLLVYLALMRGITPLQRLQEDLRRRRPSNLAPIDVEGIPDEIRPLIEALNDVMARLDSTLGAQQRFIADAAHQLKTPLTGLRSQIELIQGESRPEVMAHSLRHIAQGAENLSRLVQQLLTLTRAEAIADRGATFETVDLNLLARDVASEWAVKALVKRIDLGFEPAKGNMQISGMPVLLREMLSNLVDNAIKYTPSGGWVTVRTRDGEEPLLEVEDSGAGIPADERPKVFDRFYRVLGQESDGSGLGLAIVKEIAELHQATVSIANTRAKTGIRVGVTFPPAEGARPVAVEVPSVSP